MYLWWVMRRLEIDKWLECLVHSMYKDVRRKLRVGGGFSEELGVVVGVHLGLCPEPASLNHCDRGTI